MKNICSVDDVFGIRRDLPLNYVARPEVDDLFIDHLSKRQNIIIYGGSKQGKTALRKRCLAETDHIVVSCQKKWTLADLHCSILKEAAFSLKRSMEKAGACARPDQCRFFCQGRVLHVAEPSGQRTAEAGEAEILPPIKLDLLDPNDVVRVLADMQFSSYIVLEDFHYLPEGTQRDFSFSLKTFHENTEISFIILAAWRDENRLSTLNGDLTDRVLPVNTDRWSRESLSAVMGAGASMLGIAFDEEFRRQLLSACCDSVHLVQEACRRACRAANVHETQDSVTGVGAGLNVSDLVRRIVGEQAARYNGFVEGFSGASQASELEMPKWLIYAMLCHGAEQLDRGIRLKKIYGIIKARHPRRKSLDKSHVTQTLSALPSLQNQRGIRPFVLDYDASRTSLQVVDRQFLIWLAGQKVTELCDELGLPAPLSESEMRAL
ncbi:hypothetical protein [Rhizobium sp. CSW-27]|uniref:hypothetical protein n=1 Tax=Rhizobium sp. CSW-27 TaxID=2839985 RepID=UPI001C01D367|nr:hypothetical protein [Rhizobium sp. CSW-27]MBT9373288.1 hypothetical protein [Rhizobium sp. CSW-27]